MNEPLHLLLEIFCITITPPYLLLETPLFSPMLVLMDDIHTRKPHSVTLLVLELCFHVPGSLCILHLYVTNCGCVLWWFKKKKTKQRGGWSQCVCLKFFRPDITSVYKAQWLFAVNRLVCVGVCLFLSFSLSLNLSFHSNGLLAKIMHFPCLIMG